MAGRLPVLSMQSPYGDPGSPGYQGSLFKGAGRTIGTAIGSGIGGSIPALTAAGGVAGGLAGGIAGGLAGPAASAAGSAFGAAAGAPLGPVGVAAFGIAGGLIGAGLDYLFGRSTKKAPKPPSIKAGFMPQQTYKAPASSIRDPGTAIAPVGMSPNVRLGAANNLKKKMFS